MTMVITAPLERASTGLQYPDGASLTFSTQPRHQLLERPALRRYGAVSDHRLCQKDGNSLPVGTLSTDTMQYQVVVNATSAGGSGPSILWDITPAGKGRSTKNPRCLSLRSTPRQADGDDQPGSRGSLTRPTIARSSSTLCSASR